MSDEASAQLVRLPEPGGAYVYRCNECRALLIDKEDARAHLWWHDTLAQVGRVRELHDRLVASRNDRGHYFAGLLRRALDGD